MIVKGEDGSEYGYIEDIAEDLIARGIINAEQRIRDWKRRDLLKAAGYVGRRPVFRMADVLDVEKTTRLAVTRRGGPPRLTSEATHRTLILSLEQMRPKGPATVPGTVTFGAGDP
jgi:hypothetical protein